MTALTIKTNNQPRKLKSIYDFSPADQVKVREHFDWMDIEELESSYSFFKYRDNFYHLSEFLNLTSLAPSKFQDWHGYSSDSYFSGILVRLVDDNESVIVATYFS
jgi:hypothetical protein